MRRFLRKRSGFTLIEVMVAVTIMTAGAVAIMAMQQTATRGNMSARQMSKATQITRLWIERLRRDSLNWNAPGRPSNAQYLNVLAGQTRTNWFVPQPQNNAVIPTDAGGADAAFDYQGQEIADRNAPMHYCVNVRLAWVTERVDPQNPGAQPQPCPLNPAGNLQVQGCDAIRAQVRTWWRRRHHPPDNPGQFADCTAAQRVDNELDSLTPGLHAVTASTVLRWNSGQQQ